MSSGVSGSGGGTSGSLAACANQAMKPNSYHTVHKRTMRAKTPLRNCAAHVASSMAGAGTGMAAAGASSAAGAVTAGGAGAAMDGR